MNQGINYQVTADTRQAQGAFGQLGGLLGQLTNGFKLGFGIDFASRINQAIASIPGKLKEAVGIGIGFNASIEGSTIALAGMLGQMAPDRFKNLQEGLKGSKELISELRKEALTTTATFRDLVEGTQGLVGPALSAGIDLDQIPKMAAMMSRTVSAMMPWASGGQLLQEGRALITGDVGPNSFVANSLGITREQVKEATRAGKLFEFLEKSMKSFNAAADMAAMTLKGLESRLDDSFNDVMGKATEKAYEQLKKLFIAVIEFVESDQFTKLATVLGDVTQKGIAAATEGAKQAGPITEGWQMFMGALTDAMNAPRGIGAFAFAHGMRREIQAGDNFPIPGEETERTPAVTEFNFPSPEEHFKERAAAAKDIEIMLKGFRTSEMSSNGMYFTAGGQAAESEARRFQNRSVALLQQIRDALKGGLDVRLPELVG